MADIKTTGSDIIRVELSEFKEKTYINIRVWYLDKNTDEYKPTKKGISLSVNKYDELMDALAELGEDIEALGPQEVEQPEPEGDPDN